MFVKICFLTSASSNPRSFFSANDIDKLVKINMAVRETYIIINRLGLITSLVSLGNTLFPFAIEYQSNVKI